MLRVGLSPDGDITFGIKIVHLSLLKALALFIVRCSVRKSCKCTDEKENTTNSTLSEPASLLFGILSMLNFNL